MAVDSLPAPAELWRHPDPSSTQMYRFLQHVKAKYRLDIDDYHGLYKWSVENIAPFWEDVWRFCGITASKPYTEVGRLSTLPAAHRSRTVPSSGPFEHEGWTTPIAQFPWGDAPGLRPLLRCGRASSGTRVRARTCDREATRFVGEPPNP